MQSKDEDDQFDLIIALPIPDHYEFMKIPPKKKKGEES